MSQAPARAFSSTCSRPCSSDQDKTRWQENTESLLAHTCPNHAGTAFAMDWFWPGTSLDLLQRCTACAQRASLDTGLSASHKSSSGQRDLRSMVLGRLLLEETRCVLATYVEEVGCRDPRGHVRHGGSHLLAAQVRELDLRRGASPFLLRESEDRHEVRNFLSAVFRGRRR